MISMAVQVGHRTAHDPARASALPAWRQAHPGRSLLPDSLRGGQHDHGHARTSWAARQMALWSRVLAAPSASAIRPRIRDTSWPVAREAASVGRTRRVLTTQLSSWGLHELTDTAQLLASELITNALRHAHGPIRVHLRVHDAFLRCEVEDADPTGPVPRTAGADAESGRGIELVVALAQTWGSDSTLTGKTTWFELPLPGSGHDSTYAAPTQ